MYQNAWLLDLAKLTGLGYSICTFESCNQEEVLNSDWPSHVTVISWQKPW